MILLDTHVVIWLHTDDLTKLSPRALRTIEANRLAVSPIIELELAYLHEIGRTNGPAAEVIDALGASLGLTVANIGFGPLCAAAAGLTWTRDPFDRLLAAHALSEDMTVVTKDRRLLAHLDRAIWN